MRLAGPFRLLVAATLAGCSLIVSGIDLPPADAEGDALDADVAVDAEPADADLDAAADLGADAWPDAGLDAAPDAWPDAELDQAVDAAVPDAAVIAPRQLAGRWHLYGISGPEGVFEAALAVNVLGDARLESINGEPLADLVNLRADTPAPFIELGLGPYADEVRGVLDTQSGAGVLVAANAVAFATREQVPRPEALIDAGYFAHAYFPADPGAGLFGVLGLLPDSTGYVEAGRIDDTGAELEPLTLSQEVTATRHILNSPEPPERRHYTPILGGRGAVGLARRGPAEWGVSLLWNSQPVAAPPESGTWFCGGVVREAGGAVTRHRTATINGDELVWSEGGRAVLRPEAGVIYVVAESEPFFGREVAMAIPGPDGRLFALFDRDPATSEVGWGLALCVRADWE